MTAYADSSPQRWHGRLPVRRPVVIAFVVLMTGAWARPIDPADPVDRYCNTVYVLAKIIFGGRDGGITKATMREEMLSVDGVADHPRLKRDVLDIIDLAYVIAPNQPADELASLVLNDWCLGELK